MGLCECILIMTLVPNLEIGYWNWPHTLIELADFWCFVSLLIGLHRKMVCLVWHYFCRWRCQWNFIILSSPAAATAWADWKPLFSVILVKMSHWTKIQWFLSKPSVNMFATYRGGGYIFRQIRVRIELCHWS